MERNKVTEINIDKFVRNCDYHRNRCGGDECIDHCDFTGNQCIIMYWKSGDIIPDICYESQKEQE